MSDDRKSRPGALVVDLSFALRLRDAIADLEAAWVDVPAHHRPQLSRFLMLAADGQVVPYNRVDDPLLDMVKAAGEGRDDEEG